MHFGVVFTQPHMDILGAPGDYYLMGAGDGDVIYEAAQVCVHLRGGGLCIVNRQFVQKFL